MRPGHAIAAAAILLTVISAADAQTPPPQGNVPEPGGTPVDIAAALTTPDEYAWRLFMYLNRPAVPGKAGVADPARSFGDVAGQVSMVWETWAMASGRKPASSPRRMRSVTDSAASPSPSAATSLVVSISAALRRMKSTCWRESLSAGATARQL